MLFFPKIENGGGGHISLSERPVDSLILTGDLEIKDFFK